MDTPYSYLFIRTDLSIPQQIVQCAHAAGHAGHQFGEHSHMVLFGIPSEDRMLDAAQYLERHQIKFHMFHEPDDDVGYTAIATEPLCGENRTPLKKFKLLRG